MQGQTTHILKRMTGMFLLAGICISSAFSLTFLSEKFRTKEDKSLVAAAGSPAELVEGLKKLNPAERSARVAVEVQELIADPLNIDIINNVALLEALGDDPKASEAIVIEAASRTLRDAQSQLSAVNILLGKKDYAKALFHLDGLLHSSPKLTDQLFKVVTQLQQDPDGLKNVVAVLNQMPRWRSEYLRGLSTQDTSGQVAHKLLSAMRKAGGNIADGELSAFIGTQIAQKNYDLAYFTWLDSLDNQALKSVSFVYDGKFQHPSRNQYFDWSFRNYPNATIGLTAKLGEPSNQVLRIDFLGGREAFAHVQQYLMLAPGDYNFSGEWFTENFQSPTGLQWHVRCLDGGASSPPGKILGENNYWDKFEFAVTIPEENCRVQRLQLQSASKAALDQRFDGRIYFDNIKMTLKTNTQN